LSDASGFLPAGLSRAAFLRRLGLAGAGLAVAGAGGYDAARAIWSAPAVDPKIHRFVSRRDLRPPVVQVLHPAAGTAPGLLFLAPSSGPGQRGVLIADDRGEVVWFHPTSPMTAMDFRAAVYKGRPVLTWWESLPGGLGHGRHVVFDAAYREIASFPAGDGRPADLHELQITRDGTAFVTALETRRMDLRHVGGSRRGLVMGGVAQELEIPTARVLFEWRSIDHVPVTESYTDVGYPWDYFHINTIDIDPQGHLLISGRNTWTVFKVDRGSGEVRWRLGGKRSDFHLDRSARFAFQHDPRHVTPTRISMFDNGGAERRQVESQSRGLVLDLDFTTMRARIVRQLTHDPSIYGRVMGSCQHLPDGGWLVGWGSDPHVTEFADDGSIRFDATLPHGGENYRAFRLAWAGRPAAPPAVASPAPGSPTVYASWNGSTEVAAWRVEAGPHPSALRAQDAVPKRGFETELNVPPGARYAAAVAFDAGGAELARSAPVAL
jgi:hypothetical protein